MAGKAVSFDYPADSGKVVKADRFPSVGGSSQRNLSLFFPTSLINLLEKRGEGSFYWPHLLLLGGLIRSSRLYGYVLFDSAVRRKLQRTRSRLSSHFLSSLYFCSRYNYIKLEFLSSPKHNYKVYWDCPYIIVWSILRVFRWKRDRGKDRQKYIFILSMFWPAKLYWPN